MLPSKKLAVALTFLGLLFTQSAQAGLSLSSTRIIFSGNEKQASLKINNASPDEGFFQVWLDKENDEEADIPFAAVPPFAKISGSGSQELRIIAHDNRLLPQDRESVFWLNVQEIPKVSSEYAQGAASGVSFTIRQRIKLFYRPASISSDVTAATATLQFSLRPESAQSIQIENPSPHYITLINFATSPSKNASPIAEVIMLAPFSKETIKTTVPMRPGRLYFESMSDYGFPIGFEVPLTNNATSQPVARTNTAP